MDLWPQIIWILNHQKTGLACVRKGGTSVHRLKKDHSTKTVTACSRAPREEKDRETNKKQQQLVLEVKVYSLPETFVFQTEIRTLSVWMVKIHDVR